MPLTLENCHRTIRLEVLGSMDVNDSYGPTEWYKFHWIFLFWHLVYINYARTNAPKMTFAVLVLWLVQTGKQRIMKWNWWFIMRTAVYVITLVIASSCFGSPANIMFACTWFCVVHNPAIGIIAIVSKALAHSSMKTYEKCFAEIPALDNVPDVHNVQTNTRNFRINSNDG